MAFDVSGNLSPAVRPDAMPGYSFRLAKSSGFGLPASIPTRPSFLSCHNWRQISGVLHGQMTLYGIAGFPGCTITTSPGPMVVSTTLLLSAASFPLVQRLDKQQAAPAHVNPS